MNCLVNPPNGIPTSIPRADVAETVVRALKEASAVNKAFDLISYPEADSNEVTKNFDSLFAQTTSATF